VFVTNISGTLHTVAHGELVSGLGGKADHIDQAIGHYGADLLLSLLLSEAP